MWVNGPSEFIVHLDEALPTTIRDLSPAEQRASRFGSEGSDREHGATGNSLEAVRLLEGPIFPEFGAKMDEPWTLQAIKESSRTG